MKWIKASDIKNWANTQQRDAADTLPELIRRLIFATTDIEHIQEIIFPSGDSVAQEGWDGRLTTSAKSPFFPSSISAWEIGTSQSPGIKAEKDYKKRTADPLGADPSQTTFVFVTLRPWPKREQWVAEKKAEGSWKDIRVIASNELEQWLDFAPIVAFGLARKMGKPLPTGLQDIESFWNEWSSGTAPTMTPRLVISGRDREAVIVQKWLKAEPQAFKLQGDSPDEAIAFFYAAIDQLLEKEREAALSRCLVIQEEAQFREVIQLFESPLIIVASSNCAGVVGVATKNGHHVLLSIDSSLVDFGGGLRLSRPRRDIIENALVEGGISSLKSKRLSNEFGRSIPVLRRNLNSSKAVRRPDWAKPEYANILLSIVFVGTWKEDCRADQEVIEAISSLKYDEFSSQLPSLLSIVDSPIHKIGSVWTLKSHVDSWFLVSPHTSKEFLENALNVLFLLLSGVDPRFELSEEDRWAAGMLGKNRDHSGLLRRGLVESLVLLGIYGDRLSCVGSSEDYVVGTVRKILDALKSWQAMASIGDILPMLAEAAPLTFLECIEQKIDNDPSLFRELMRDEGNAIFGQCNHSGFLWAIESTAWSSESFALSIDVLRKLSELDQGGRWANRPINSMKDIFLPNRPQTYASPKERLAALDRLITSNSTLVWKFSKEYFRSGVVSESHQFRWRDSGGERRGLEPESETKYIEYVTGLSPRLNNVACARENLFDAVAELTRLPNEMSHAVITVLQKLDPKTLSREENNELRAKIRDALDWINSHGNTDQRKIGKSLKPILERLTPENPLDRVGWLLNSPWPRLPNGDRSDGTHIAEVQGNAAREILQEVEMAEIIEFSQTLEFPGVLGGALGRVNKENTQDDAFIDALVESSADNSLLFMSYSSSRIAATGRSWVSRHVQRFKDKEKVSLENYAYLYLGLPLDQKSWTAIAEEGEAMEREYWRRVTVRPRPENTEDAIIAVEKLIWAGRSFIALEIAGDPQASLPISLLKKLLQEILLADPKDHSHFAASMFTYYLRHVFNQLHNSAELSLEEMARIEWQFASLFDDLQRDDSRSLAIHRLLQKDPLTFSELIGLIYKSDDEKRQSINGDDNTEAKKKRQNLAQNARDVLYSWKLMPGVGEDGTVSAEILDGWVSAVRKRCSETGHVTCCDLEVAKMLSKSPIGEDGVWPHPAVRDLLERLRNRIIEKHIPISIFNSRGMTSRAVGEGGQQERELVEKYKGYANATKVKWPRTSAMLDSIANSYDRDAKREDIEADLDDFQWG